MVRICARCVSPHCFPFVFRSGYRCLFFCRTALYCGNLSGKKTRSFGVDVPVDGYYRCFGILSFRSLFCRWKPDRLLAADVLCRRDSRYRIICGYAVYARDATLVNRSRERAGRTGRAFAYRESGIQKRCFWSDPERSGQESWGEVRLSRTVQALAAQCRDHLHRNYVFPTVCRHQYRDLLQSQDIPYGRVRRYGFRYMGLGGRRGGQPAVHDRIGVFCRQAWKAQTLFHRSDRDHGFADSVGHLLCLLRFVGRCRQMVVRPVGLFLCCLFRYQHRPVGVAYHLRSISPETQGIGLIHRFLVRVVFQ